MHTTPQLLDALSAKLGGVTDYRLAIILGTSPGALGNWRHGRTRLSRGFALKVANMLNLPREYVVACVELERERDPDVRVVWHSIAKRFGGRVAALILLALTGLHPAAQPAVAQGLGAYSSAAASLSSLLIMRTTRRRRLTDWLERTFWTWLPVPAPVM